MLSHLHALVLWDCTTDGFPPLVQFVWAGVNAAVTLETQRFFSRTLQPGLDLFVGLCLPAGAGVEPFALPQARLWALPALTQAGVGV